MIKGSKHYFTFFGVMRAAINVALHRTFSQIEALFEKQIFVQIRHNKIEKQTIQKNQTYQG